MYMIIIMLLLVAGMFYFSSQQNKKAQENSIKLRNSIEVGSFVGTHSGMIGCVVEIGEKYIKLDLGETSATFVKEAIVRTLTNDEISSYKSLGLNSDNKDASFEDIKDSDVENLENNESKSKREEYGF